MYRPYRPPPRRNPLWVFALLIVAGVALLLFLGFAPQETSFALHDPLRDSLPTARVLPRAARAARAVAVAPTATSQEPTVTSQEPTVSSGQLAPQPTLTATPQLLPPVLAPDSSSVPVPTLFPTPPPEPASIAPLPNAGPARPIPILMYHYIRTVDQASDPLGFDLSVPSDMFTAQMDWLQQNGYATVRMDTLNRCRNGTAACPTKAVALTFDDGYDDAYSAALPVLQQHGFVGTFYIISGLVGQPHYMGWNELAALRDADMEIGAHTIDHLDLTTLDPAESNREIAQSKADLEHGLGITIEGFCYPSGRYNAAVEEQVRAAGYSTATTTRQDQDWSDVLGLPRMRVVGGKPLDYFAALVQGY